MSSDDQRPDAARTGPSADGDAPPDVERFIERALAYVPSVARRYLGCGLPFDELLAAGNLGLVEAALRFDPERGVRFVTYADWWIRKTILKAIQEQSGPVRLPRYRRERLRLLHALRAELRAAYGREPSDDEVAAAGGMSRREIRRLDDLTRSTVSLEEPSGEGGRSVSDTLATRDVESDPESFIDEDYHLHVRRLLGDLEPRERLVLMLRFGFLGSDPMTLRELGRHLGLSRERVRQIELRALRRLRELLEDAGSPGVG